MEETLPFDEDLQKIIAKRAFAKLREFRRNLEIFECGKQKLIPWDDPNFWEPYFIHICQREIFVKLHDEVKRYREKYQKSDYETDIKNARNGSDISLCKIIKWDKAWVFIDWVEQRILNAQENSDLNFLGGIGDAISRKPGVKKIVRTKDEEDNKLILALVESAIIYHKIGLPADSSNPLFRKFFDILADQDFFPDALCDFDYFIKYLRRHSIIK